MKVEFESQHYWLKWICALPLVAAALWLQSMIADRMGMIAYCICCGLIMLALLGGYYQLTERLRLFCSQGCFWAEEDAVFIQLGKRLYKIDDSVTELLGEDPTLFAFYHFTWLSIRTQGKKIKIFGESLHGDQTFQDSRLYQLMELILERNKDLHPKVIAGVDMDLWYVR